MHTYIQCNKTRKYVHIIYIYILCLLCCKVAKINYLIMSYKVLINLPTVVPYLAPHRPPLRHSKL